METLEWRAPAAAFLYIACAASLAYAAPGRAASMNAAREGHTATILKEGGVLVAGGFGGSGALRSVELYRADGGWKAAAPMTSRRASHTATLLPDGRVLVAGGYDGKSILASAELYDPTNDQWAPLGPLKTARYAHVAALLPDGRVLLAGGVSEKGVAASAELFDPNTKTFRSAAPMKAPRYGAAAAVLRDGRVLVCGGGSPALLSSVELFDARGGSAEGSWALTGKMREARAFHTATLISGGMVIAAGGQGEGLRALASAELYDPVEGKWAGAVPMDAARAFHTATLLPGGRVLVAGGAALDGPPGAVEAYDPGNGGWAALGRLAAPRYRHSAVLLGGDVLVVGGRDRKGTLDSAELIAGAAAPAAPKVAASTAGATAPAAAVAPAIPTAAPAPAARLARFERQYETVYWVQLGAFTDAARAQALADSLNADGNFAEVQMTKVRGVLFRKVRIGPFPNKADAQSERDNLAKQGVQGLVVAQRAPKS